MEVNVILRNNIAYHNEVHLRVIDDMPETSSGSKCLVVVLDAQYEVIMIGALKERTRYDLATWLYE